MSNIPFLKWTNNGVLDAQGEYDASHNSQPWALTGKKRSGIELLGLTHSVEEHDTDLKVVPQ